MSGLGALVHVDDDKKKRKLSTIPIVGITAGGIVLLSLIIGFIIWYFSHKKVTDTQRNIDILDKEIQEILNNKTTN
jgi:hypothetical protein